MNRILKKIGTFIKERNDELGLVLAMIVTIACIAIASAAIAVNL